MPHSSRKPSKFIAKSDDVNIGSYLYHEVDENICLYRAYSMSNSHMKDGLLKEFNLQPTCDTMPQSNTSACWNTLRFTNRTDPTKLNDGMGIDNKVICKLIKIAL